MKKSHRTSRAVFCFCCDARSMQATFADLTNANVCCLLFSFSSSVTFGDIKNKAKFIIVTGDNFDWFTYQNDLLYKILIHWGWMMA